MPRTSGKRKLKMSILEVSKIKLAVIGLGYVGLPLALGFSKKGIATIAFDTNVERVKQLNLGFDSNLEFGEECFDKNCNIEFVDSPERLASEDVDIFIITVPTPVDEFNKPDLASLKAASVTVGRVLKAGGIVVYESTVFPGCTEEVCVPILEKNSGLSFNESFFVGYSPERINPGDSSKSLSDIVKVVAGSTMGVQEYLADLYRLVVTAGICTAPTIRVAEAAKVIENIQRDINIALVNELAMLFSILEIDIKAVLEVASTKWNFVPFKPGLVGGHCIGVDPYYLTYKAEQVGFRSNVILAGRSVNQSMPAFIVERLKAMINGVGKNFIGASGLILGLTFKANVPDFRNSLVFDLISRLYDEGVGVKCADPYSTFLCGKYSKRLDLVSLKTSIRDLDFIVIAVGHQEYKSLSVDKIREFLSADGVIFDITGEFCELGRLQEDFRYFTL